MTKKERKELKSRQREKSLARNIRNEKVKFPGQVTRPDRGMFTRFRSEWVEGYESGTIVEETLLPYVSQPIDSTPLTKTECQGVIWNTGYKPVKNPNSRTPLGQKVMAARVRQDRAMGKSPGVRSTYHEKSNGVRNPKYDK